MLPEESVAGDLRGTRLGRYELLAKIASGGMATVYLARARGESDFSRVVAVKILHRHLADNAEFIAMFRDEARIAARVRNPHVVDVYDISMLDGQLVLAMEYVEGVSLHRLFVDRQERQLQVPPSILLRIMVDALRGLHAAHELTDDRGEPLAIVHRDVTPHNILVGGDGLARVADFGIAKARGRTGAPTESGVLKGKLHYFSPEQLRGGSNIDRRTDIFAAGVVIWEGLTGRRLFRGENEAETLLAILQQPIVPPSTHCGDVSLELDRICMRALERDRDKRFPTAESLAGAIEACGSKLASTAEVGSYIDRMYCQELELLREAARKPISNPSVRVTQPLALTGFQGVTARIKTLLLPRERRNHKWWVMSVATIATVLMLTLALVVRSRRPSHVERDTVPHPDAPSSSASLAVVPNTENATLAPPESTSTSTPSPAPTSSSTARSTGAPSVAVKSKGRPKPPMKAPPPPHPAGPPPPPPPTTTALSAGAPFVPPGL